MSEKMNISINGKNRKMNAAELTQFEKDRLEYEAEQNRIKAEQTAKEELKQSAIAKLAAIGLTEDEAKIIIGVN